MITVAKKKIIDIYRENGIKSINPMSKPLEIIPRIFIFYNKYNSDESYIEEIEDKVINGHKYLKLGDYNDEEFEIIGYIKPNSFSIEDIKELLNDIDVDLSLSLSGQTNNDIEGLKNFLISNKIILDNQIRVTILTDESLNYEEKSIIKDFVTNYNSMLPKTNYNILFSDDLSEIILDVDSPKLFVESGKLELKDKNEFIIHGNEKSIITNIMAKSLKNLYVHHGTSGLFSSNLRYYVKSLKIDRSIKDTIIHEPENFWYFNNGIIITCDEYNIKEGFLHLRNFSIVNGGQTTNIIGNTEFDVDFPIVCKIIRNKFSDENDNQEFLSRVAETSNTQKPIRAIDLISNRVEQKRLKIQLNKVGIFLQVKRGEKINKKVYPKKWQQAKNDELGQMLFSFVYQSPGIARNSKSKMLLNDKYYDKIFKNTYNSNFLVTLQQFKVSYNDWRKEVVKTSNFNELVGLAKNGFFLSMSVIGLFVKLNYNNTLLKNIREKLEILDVDEYDSLEVYISQNDIGQLSFLNNPYTFSRTNRAKVIFDDIFRGIIVPSYREYKKDYPSQAYSNFTKTNKNYYKYVLPEIVNKFNNSNYFKDLFGDLVISKIDNQNIKIFDIKLQSDEYKPGLFEELKEWVDKKFLEYSAMIPKNEILNKNEITRIVYKKPRDLYDLSHEIGLSKDKIDNYGFEIISIIEKYIII